MADPPSVAGAFESVVWFFNSIAATGIFGTLWGLVFWYFREVRRKRKALARMLVAEIRSFVAVIDKTELADSFASLVRDPPKIGTKWAGGSTENYFTLFEENAADLGFLNPSVVDSITACYSFMKGSRDATRLLASWDTPGYTDDQRISDVRCVSRLVACSLDKAIEALRGLGQTDQSFLSSTEELARRFRAIAEEEPAPVLSIDLSYNDAVDPI